MTGMLSQYPPFYHFFWDKLDAEIDNFSTNNPVKPNMELILLATFSGNCKPIFGEAPQVVQRPTTNSLMCSFHDIP